MMVMVMDMEAIPYTIFLIPYIIHVQRVFVFVYREKNVIINCVD